MQIQPNSKTSVSAVVCLATMALSAVSNAALETRAWVGNTDYKWNTHSNWSPASAPLSGDRIVVFNAASTYQPAISTHVTVISGIWMTGSTVTSTTITSDPTGQNGGAPTFQTNGNNPINGFANSGVLMEHTNGANLTISTSAFKVGFSQAWTNNSTGLLTMSTGMNLNGQTLTVNGSGNTLFSGAITNATGTGAITKDGGGTLTLSNATNTYNGATTLTDGKLIVTGALSSSSAAVTANGGTLGGTGTIGRPTTINAGATINPGVDNTIAGTLSLDRSLILGGTSAFDLITPSSHDKLAVNTPNTTTYNLTFGGTLQVNDAGTTFAVGQVYDLFNWGATKTTVSGTFSSINLPTLPSGMAWKMFGAQAFDYSTGQIVVTVPEPLTATWLAIGLLLTHRRRRQ